MLLGIVNIELSVFTDLFLNESGDFTIIRNKNELSLRATNYLSNSYFHIVLFLFTQKMVEAATFDNPTEMIELSLKFI
jgi:hypothetical protein